MAYSTTPSAPAAGSTITADGTAIIAGLVGNEAGFVLEAFDTAGNVITRTSALNPFGVASTSPGGPGTFAALTDAPAANTLLAAALAGLSNDTLTQKQRIDAVLLALAPLQADPTTKSYVDNLVQAISNIDASQATAIQQLQQHLASDDGLLQGILATQATHTTQIAANTATGQQNATWIGSMSSLLSSAKDSLVNAYNELFSKVTLNTSNIAKLFAAQPVAGLGLAQAGNVFSLTLDAPLTPLPAGTAGGLVSNTDGTVVTGNATTDAYTYSPFLPLTPGVNVIFNFYPQYSAFYDANKVYISGIPRSGVAPPNAAFMRVSSDTDGTGAAGAQLSHVLYSSLRANLGGLPYVRGLVNQGTPLYPNAKGFVDVAAFVSGSNSAPSPSSPAYTLPPATTSTLGGVSISTGLSVDAAGRLTTNSDRVYFERWTINDGQYMQATTTNAADGYQYYPLMPPRRLSQNLPVGATGYDPATGIFIAPFHALYQVLVFLAVAPGQLSPNDNFIAIIGPPGNARPPITSQWNVVAASDFNEFTMIDIIELQAGQQTRAYAGFTNANAGRQINIVNRITYSLYKFLS